MPNQNKIIDEYIKPRRKKKILVNKKEFSVQKRNREDLLESTIVKKRVDKASSEKDNENYGTYIV